MILSRAVQTRPLWSLRVQMIESRRLNKVTTLYAGLCRLEAAGAVADVATAIRQIRKASDSRNELPRRAKQLRSQHAKLRVRELRCPINTTRRQVVRMAQIAMPAAVWRDS